MKDFKVGDITCVACGENSNVIEIRVIEKIIDSTVYIRILDRYKKDTNHWIKHNYKYVRISRHLFWLHNFKVEKDSELMCQIFVNLMLK